MKKLFLIILAIFLFPTLCLSAEVISSHKTSRGELIVQSDNRTFDIIKGIYELQGNVHVQLPIRKKNITIKGDRTTVHIYQQEVHCEGNIKLIYNDLNFTCDAVDVYHENKTAYVRGNIIFDHNGTVITADKGEYNWKTKLATFSGNVIVNGVPKNNSVTYHVIKKMFI